MDQMGGDIMTIRFVTDEKIAETSSKGNQEKWYDETTNRWYKLDRFGYEALAETVVSILLKKSNIETDMPFTFTRYKMERINVHGRDRTACSSENFLKNGQSIITLSRLFSRHLGFPLKDKLKQFSSDKKRIEYLAEATVQYTGLMDFPRYLTLLFEVDALFLNDDRHLNNIAVIEHNGKFSYCPIFDNGAGLLSDAQNSPMDIEPEFLIKKLVARPFNMTFTRQMNTARALYGSQLKIPKFSKVEMTEILQPILEYYSQRDRGIITDRVVASILTRQKFN